MGSQLHFESTVLVKNSRSCTSWPVERYLKPHAEIPRRMRTPRMMRRVEGGELVGSRWCKSKVGFLVGIAGVRGLVLSAAARGPDLRLSIP